MDVINILDPIIFPVSRQCPTEKCNIVMMKPKWIKEEATIMALNGKCHPEYVHGKQMVISTEGNDVPGR